MFIQTEDTPNPNTLKFIPGLVVLEEGTMEFVNDQEAHNSELASLLFKVNDVERVFFGCDFISVTKSEGGKWEVMKPGILTTIMEYFTIYGAGNITNVFTDSEVEVEYEEGDKEVVEQIQELIFTRIKPAVMQDGGDVQLRKYKDGVVFLQLKGACAGCPSAALTLKDGIQDMLQYYLPDIKAVEAVE